MAVLFKINTLWSYNFVRGLVDVQREMDSELEPETVVKLYELVCTYIRNRHNFENGNILNIEYTAYNATLANELQKLDVSYTYVHYYFQLLYNDIKGGFNQFFAKTSLLNISSYQNQRGEIEALIVTGQVH